MPNDKKTSKQPGTNKTKPERPDDASERRDSGPAGAVKSDQTDETREKMTQPGIDENEPIEPAMDDEEEDIEGTEEEPIEGERR